MHLSISPYVTGRICRLGVDRLSSLSADSFWADVQRAEAAGAYAAQVGEETSDALLPLVQAAGEQRGRLVALRRDIHNGRLTRVRHALKRDDIPDEVRIRIAPWLDAAEQAAVLKESLPGRYDDWIAQWRHAAADLFYHDSIAGAVQLSGEGLYASIERYIKADCGATWKPAKARSVEASLTNFFYRAALKPSPFGRFVTVSAFPADSVRSDAVGERDEHSVVRANRVLVNWLFGLSTFADLESEIAHVSLNSTLEVTDELLRYVANSRELGARGYCGYAVVRLKKEGVLRDLVDLLQTGPASAAECVALLAAKIEDRKKATTVLNALVASGLLFMRAATPEQDPRYLKALVAGVAKDPSDRAALVAAPLTSLVEMEAHYAESSLERRADMLAQVRDQVGRLTERLMIDGPPAESLKAPVYEDVVASTTPSSWDRAVVESHLPTLDALGDLAAIMDYGQLKRIGLYAFSRSVGGMMSLTDLFEKFVALPTAGQDDVLAGRSCEEAEVFLAERRSFKSALVDAMQVDDDGWTFSAADLKDAVGLVPHAARAESITFRLQMALDASAPSGTGLIVNGVNTGFGAFFSRFCGELGAAEDNSWSLEAAVREHLAAQFPHQADVNAVFGLNFNIHPRLAGAVIDYPGGVVPATANRLLLKDLVAVPDDEHQTVRVVHRETGAPVDLMPMNFLIPLWSPPLYKMIEALSPTILYPWRVAADLVGGPPGTVSVETRRLTVDGVVIDRRSWTLPASECPYLEELAKGDLAAILAFDEWRQAQGWPLHAFVLCQTVAEYDLLGGRNPLLARSLDRVTHMRKAAVHKPMFVDFRNPMLLRSLARTATSRPDTVLFVRECLPDIADYDSPLLGATAEEFFVEVNLRD